METWLPLPSVPLVSWHFLDLGPFRCKTMKEHPHDDPSVVAQPPRDGSPTKEMADIYLIDL